MNNSTQMVLAVFPDGKLCCVHFASRTSYSVIWGTITIRVYRTHIHNGEWNGKTAEEVWSNCEQCKEEIKCYNESDCKPDDVNV